MANKRALIIGVSILVLIVVSALIFYSKNLGVSPSTNNTEQPAVDETKKPPVDPQADVSADSTVNNPSFVPPKEDKQSAPAASVSISIDNFIYSPATLTVKKGTKVTWTNKDSAAHTVTAETEGPDSPLMKQNETYSYTFNNVGTFSYYCKPHPWMKASVIVTE